MKKYIIGFIIGVIVASGGVMAANYLYEAENIRYGKTNVGSALNDLYQKHTYGDATSEDIVKGKTALINGEKVTGSLEIPNLISETSGTATSSSILSGYTAWVNGEKITGNYICPSCPGYINKDGGTTNLASGGSTSLASGRYNYTNKWTISCASCPSLASQTSGDATASDILSGKTAWVNGNKVTGTYEPLGTTFGTALYSQTLGTIAPKTTTLTLSKGKYIVSALLGQASFYSTNQTTYYNSWSTITCSNCVVQKLAGRYYEDHASTTNWSPNYITAAFEQILVYVEINSNNTTISCTRDISNNLTMYPEYVTLQAVKIN